MTAQDNFSQDGADAGSAAGGVSIAAFPPAPPNLFAVDAKLQSAVNAALDSAVAAVGAPPGSFPVPVSIIDISDPQVALSMAGWLENELDYIASEVKVGVMYAAYAFRDMVRRYAQLGGFNDSAKMFSQIAIDLKEPILSAVPALRTAPSISDTHRLPKYQSVLQAIPQNSLLRIEFTAQYDRALEQMIVPSSNADAAKCIHGLGYSYLNGALAAANLLDLTAFKGLWAGGDFMHGTQYPAAKLVLSANDGPSAQAGTAHLMAQLLALIATKKILDPTACDEMLQRLSHAASGVDTPYISRSGLIGVSNITHNKLGWGPLNKGHNACSEVSVIQDLVAPGHRYVVAWQNLSDDPANIYKLGTLATITRDVIAAYES